VAASASAAIPPRTVWRGSKFPRGCNTRSSSRLTPTPHPPPTRARSRERNRVHARKSRLRKKFFVDSLKGSMTDVAEENKRMRELLMQHTGCTYEQLTAEGAVPAAVPARGPKSSLLAAPGQMPSAVLEGADYSLVEAVTKTQNSFVISDPTVPDNPIVFASSGFYDLTGFGPSEVIGRNCRLLQGRDTDQAALVAIRMAIADGRDCAVVLLNYKKDGTPFWNRFFIAPLRGLDGKVVNYVGVQCEVKPAMAACMAKVVLGELPKEYLPGAGAGATVALPPLLGMSAAGPSGRSRPAAGARR
jgi:PAS domain S-box-containing protein